MFRTLLHVVTILHLGPAIAFALVAFGCDGIDPPLGRGCQGGSLKLFVEATLASWFVLGLGSVAYLRSRRARSALPK